MRRMGAILLAVAATLGAPTAQAQLASFVELEESINIVGLGVGVLPDYWGSDDYQGGVGPFLRYNFRGSQRFVQVLGPEVLLNLLDDPKWRMGPMLRYRFGRDSDVDDPVVRRMRPIDETIEAGLFVTYSMRLAPDPRHRLNFTAEVVTDVGNEHKGTTAVLRTSYWHPLSRALAANVGAGLAYGSDNVVNTYFGVNGSDVALFPSLGGRPYNASGGVTNYRIWGGLALHLSPQWHLGVGARYQVLLGDAADSPIVRERGSRGQWIAGAALGYAWK